jgi:hypothetical protein
MTRYVFIESRDPFESRDTRFVEETAVAVKERGHDVTVFLVQNGVLAARKSADRLGRLAQCVTISKSVGSIARITWLVCG